MTVSRPCYFGNLLLGVVGVDVNLAYILEDVTYYQDSLASYTFLIDNKGQSHRAAVTAAVTQYSRSIDSVNLNVVRVNITRKASQSGTANVHKSLTAE